MHSLILQLTMRTYNNSKDGFAKVDKVRDQSGHKKVVRERTSNEWDIRIDADNMYLEEIISNLKTQEDILTYALVSGLEQPDTASYGSKDIHTHLALVFKYNLRRDQVLAICRGNIKKTDEYAVPRNRKFTYAGWYMHHTKLDWKLVVEPAFRYEHGVLPADEQDDETKKKVQLMFKKFGGDDDGHAVANKCKFINYLA